MINKGTCREYEIVRDLVIEKIPLTLTQRILYDTHLELCEDCQQKFSGLEKGRESTENSQGEA